MVKTVVKENGKIEDYDFEKARNAIYKTMVGLDGYKENKSLATKLAKKVEASFEDEQIAASDWADSAFKVLKEHNKELANSYVEGRVTKQLNRLKNSSLMKSFKDILGSSGDNEDSVNTENANLNGFDPAAQLHRIGSETNKEYVLNYILPRNLSNMHREKWIHIHDLDYFELNPNCLQIDLKAVLKDGYSTGNGLNTEPKSIMTATMLAAIALQSSTNNMHGGQSLADLDIALAKYVNISYRKYFKGAVDNYYEISGKEIPLFITKRMINKLYYGITIDDLKTYRDEYFDKEERLTNSKLSIIDNFLRVANKNTEKETDQSMQGLCHNLNTLHSRAANQPPFSSVNIGIDISEAGRLVSRCLIKNIMHGSGRGETFIYPIVIFHLLEGINYYPGDPNYDLFQLAMKSSSIRLYPNYIFLDSPFQFQYLRDKRGKLLWKAKQDWYIDKGYLSLEELNSLGEDNSVLHSNLIERIRKIQEVDRTVRKKNQDDLFDVKSFIDGSSNQVAVRKARAKGVQLPFSIDSLRVGIDDRTLPSRMGCIDGKETITYKIGDDVYQEIPMEIAIKHIAMVIE